MPGGDSGVAKNWARPLNCLSGKKSLPKAVFLQQDTVSSADVVSRGQSKAGGKAGLALSVPTVQRALDALSQVQEPQGPRDLSSLCMLSTHSLLATLLVLKAQNNYY